MSLKWELYCNTEQAVVSTWSDVEPVVCPNNPSDEIAEGSAHVAMVARPSLHIGYNLTTSSTSYTTLTSYQYPGSNYYTVDSDKPKYLKVVASIPAGTYDIRLIDSSNNVLASSTGNSNTTPQYLSFDLESIAPSTGPSYIDIQAKTSGTLLTISSAQTYDMATL